MKKLNLDRVGRAAYLLVLHVEEAYGKTMKRDRRVAVSVAYKDYLELRRAVKATFSVAPK